MQTSKQEIIRRQELSSILQISLTTIWRLTKARKMPQPIRLSSRIIGWRRVEIENWLNNK
jgi:predicted DNA-binding transcriptional regulator AlpA